MSSTSLQPSASSSRTTLSGSTASLKIESHSGTHQTSNFDTSTYPTAYPYHSATHANSTHKASNSTLDYRCTRNIGCLNPVVRTQVPSIATPTLSYASQFVEHGSSQVALSPTNSLRQPALTVGALTPTNAIAVPSLAASDQGQSNDGSGIRPLVPSALSPTNVVAKPTLAVNGGNGGHSGHNPAVSALDPAPSVAAPTLAVDGGIATLPNPQEAQRANPASNSAAVDGIAAAVGALVTSLGTSGSQTGSGHGKSAGNEDGGSSNGGVAAVMGGIREGASGGDGGHPASGSSSQPGHGSSEDEGLAAKGQPNQSGSSKQDGTGNSPASSESAGLSNESGPATNIENEQSSPSSTRPGSAANNVLIPLTHTTLTAHALTPSPDKTNPTTPRDLILGSDTLRPDAATAISGQSISYAANGVIYVNNEPQATLAPPTASTNAQPPQKIAIPLPGAGSTFIAVAIASPTGGSGNSQATALALVIEGHTLRAGASIVVDGQTVSYAANGIVYDNGRPVATASALLPDQASNLLKKEEIPLPLPSAHTTLTAAVLPTSASTGSRPTELALALGGTTLLPGAVTTMPGGDVVSYATNGVVFVDGKPVATAEPSPQSQDEEIALPLPHAHTTFIASAISGTSSASTSSRPTESALLIDGHTLQPGGPALTLAGGDVVSYASDGVVFVDGKAVVTVPPVAATSARGSETATGTGTGSAAATAAEGTSRGASAAQGTASAHANASNAAVRCANQSLWRFMAGMTCMMAVSGLVL